MSGQSAFAPLVTRAHDTVFLGLGRMGIPMAIRLTAAGRSVLGADPSPAARERARAAGLECTEDAVAGVAAADVVVTMLPDDRAALALVWSGELLDALRPGTLWLEMTSSSPAATRELAAAVSARGGVLVDAPVSGGVRGAQDGTLTILVGAPDAALARARPLLEALGSRIVQVGERPGDGDLAKTLNNMLSAINLTAAAEAVALARRDGLRLDAFVDAVVASTGGSHAMAEKVRARALAGRFDAGFTIDQYRKDLRIALEAYADAGLTGELGALTRRLWDELADSGHGGEDHTRVVTLVDERALG